MALVDKKLMSTVNLLVNHLANARYDELARLTDTIRMRAEEIKESIDSYPGTVIAVVRPEDLDVIKINTAKEECWSVNVRLHTSQEGPSDLTMSLTIIQSNSDYYAVELEDIHVL
jgi:hypothetical protein